jgi:DNA-binding response OmpR family regulator
MSDPARPLVLVVEDDPVIAQLLTILCSQLGFRALKAPDGEAAVAALQRERPQLITLDLNLPQLSGQEVLAHVRASEALCATPVVVVSALDPEDAVRDQADAVVKKPFEVEGLIALMQRLVTAPQPLKERAVGR